ncbi:hypothetical protein [Cyanothece sp. BG0011]|uniref:hypothetical protein n=1 Tax=Cyanothece sp. BG0011 TaxID=2082950 RepID=UPI0018E52569|nr:hypothetical protein [Cyanothece sp. BG0011]
MIKLHPEFLTKNGQKEFAVLPYEEFLQVQELLEKIQIIEHKSNGEKMAEALRKIAKNNTFSEIDARKWQKKYPPRSFPS